MNSASTVLRASEETKALAASRFHIDDALESSIVWQLKQHSRDVLRAPYFAWAQLSSFFLPANLYLSEVYGSVELLAFPGVARVITHIDEDSMMFDYVVKEEVMEAAAAVVQSASPLVQFGLEEFQEWVLLDSVLPAFMLPFIPADLAQVVASAAEYAKMEVQGHADASTPAASMTPAGASYEATIAAPHWGTGPAATGGALSSNGAGVLHRSVNSLTRLLLGAATNDQARRMNCSMAVLDAPVLTLDAVVAPLSVLCETPRHSDIPLMQVLGSPLPTALYFALSAGLLSPFALTSVAQDIIIHRIPYVDSPHFRKVMNTLINVRAMTAQAIRQCYGNLSHVTFLYQEYVKPRGGDSPASQLFHLKNEVYARPLSEHWPVCGDGFINHPHRIPRHGSTWSERSTVFSAPLSFFDVVHFAKSKMNDESAIQFSANAALNALQRMRGEIESPSVSSPYPLSQFPGGGGDIASASHGGGLGVPAMFNLVQEDLDLNDMLPPTSATIPECCAMVLLKTLDFLGYFSHDSPVNGLPPPASLSVWGSLLHHVGHENGGMGPCTFSESATTTHHNSTTTHPYAPPHSYPPNTPIPAFSPSASSELMPKAPSGWTHMSEYVVLLVDLARSGALTDEPIVFSLNTEARPYERGIRFAARILSVVPITLSATAATGPSGALSSTATNRIPRSVDAKASAGSEESHSHAVAWNWTGPTDPEMAAFHSITRSLLHSLRETLEAMTTVLFMMRTTLVPMEHMSEVIQSLPFGGPREFLTGNVMLYLLLMYAQEEPRQQQTSNGVDGTSSTFTLEHLQRVFPEWVGGADDLWWWREFWRRAMRVLLSPDFRDAGGQEKNYALKNMDVMRHANELVEGALSRLLASSQLVPGTSSTSTQRAEGMEGGEV